MSTEFGALDDGDGSAEDGGGSSAPTNADDAVALGADGKGDKASAGGGEGSGPDGASDGGAAQTGASGEGNASETDANVEEITLDGTVITVDQTDGHLADDLRDVAQCVGDQAGTIAGATGVAALTAASTGGPGAALLYGALTAVVTTAGIAGSCASDVTDAKSESD